MNVQGENIPCENVHEDDVSKEENNMTLVLCVDEQVNGIQLIFLIDGGASEYFISETLVEDNDLP